MSCGNTNKCYQKSCQRYYNNNAQALNAGENITLTIAGNKVVNTGVSITTEPQSFVINKHGLYHISADIVINSTATGAVTLQAYKDGIALPCTLKTVTLPATGYTELHTETDIVVGGCCCNLSSSITFVITSVDTAVGTVVESCFGAIKMA